MLYFIKSILVTLFFFFSLTVFASEPTKDLSLEEKNSIIALVNKTVNAFETEDAKSIAELTFKPIVDLVGGLEAFTTITKNGIVQLKKQGMAIENVTVGTPGQLILAGEYRVCFVPKVTILKNAKTRGRSTSFMVAVQKNGESEWSFIEGSGVVKNPAILKILIPDLPDGIILPEHKVEFNI